MISIQTQNDLLDLDLVKQHLVVDHDDDDILIETYIKASIGYVEAYIHERILDEMYESEQHELILIDMNYRLRLPIAPKHVIVTIGTHTDEIPFGSWQYSNGYLTIPPVAHIVPTSFQAMIGLDPRWVEAVNQARLLLIGQFYNYRESVVDLRITELPTGVKFVLDNVTGASI